LYIASLEEAADGRRPGFKFTLDVPLDHGPVVLLVQEVAERWILRVKLFRLVDELIPLELAAFERAVAPDRLWAGLDALSGEQVPHVCVASRKDHALSFASLGDG